METEWKSIEELPMDESMNRKVLILSESTISGNTSLHITTDYWNVFFDDRNVDWNIFDKKKKHSDNKYAYGRFGERKIPLGKIRGWTYADGIINCLSKHNKIEKMNK